MVYSAAVKAAGLVDTLNGTGPFTIFAPSNDAFAKIDKATLDSLLADPKGALTKILTYHVVPGKVPAAEVKNGNANITVFAGGGGPAHRRALLAQEHRQRLGPRLHVLPQLVVPRGGAPASARRSGSSGGA